MAVVAEAVIGLGVTMVLEKVLKEVRLLAASNNSFLGLRNLLCRLKEPTAYLVNHKDKAGEIIVHEWLTSLCKELVEADSLVIKWQRIKRWDLRGRHKALKRMIRITTNLEHLDSAQTVNLASNVHNFDRLSGGVGRLGKGVDRLGEEVVEVKTSLNSLTSEVRSLTVERNELAQVTKDAFTNYYCATLPEAVEEIRKALRTGVSRANVTGGSGPSRSPKVVTHFNAKTSFPDEVFGGDDILDNMVAEILDGDFHKCIGLCSMGGAGKTFTAGRVYHDPLQSYFNGTKHRLWVTASKRSTIPIMEEIFMKLGGEVDCFRAADDAYGMRSALKRQLNLDKFVLVIDDVWEKEQLDFINLILESKDSNRRVILVTTRVKEILERKHVTKIEVSLLSEDDSWKLFSRKAFGHAEVPRELRDVSRSVAAECKRLPLALKVIGSTLAGETKSQRWENSLKKLKQASVLSKEHEEQVFGRLQLSVDNLCDRDESGSRLQDCFYYFAAYPEDAEIDGRELVNLWTADGIVGNDPDSPISSEDEAYELLGSLIALSMIELRSVEVGCWEPSARCKIHDVMRDLARYNLENNFGKNFSRTEKISTCQRPCLYRPGLKLSKFPEDWTIPRGADATTSTELSVKRLSLMSNKLQQLPGNFNAPHLRVLLLGRNHFLRSLPEQFFKSFRSLRSLDLQGTDIEEMPEAVFNLISLVSFNLNFCDSLRQISASIQCLQNLQQLQLRRCDMLCSVPRGLRSLKSLKVLDAYGTNIWDENTSSEEVATLEDVALLKSLQSLSIHSYRQLQLSQMGGLTALQSLTLFCPNLKELPQSFTKLTNLKSLDLSFCFRLACLPALDELQHLEELYLQSNVLDSFLDSFFRSGAFPSLQRLHTACRGLRCPILQRGAMPQIKSFFVMYSNAKDLHASFQALSSLFYLELSEWKTLERLFAFDEPNSFPYLKEVNFRGSSSLRNLPAGMLKSAPDLCTVVFDKIGLSRSDIPDDLLEKEKRNQLIVHFE